MKRSAMYTPFESASYLQDEEIIRAYLRAALDDPTPGALLLALQRVSCALQEGRAELGRPAK